MYFYQIKCRIYRQVMAQIKGASASAQTVQRSLQVLLATVNDILISTLPGRIFPLTVDCQRKYLSCYDCKLHDKERTMP